MAKPELGTKRQCLTCASRFYDLNRSPILCPKCGSVFQVAALAAARPEAAPARAEEIEAEPAAAPELVPLEEADAAEDGQVTVAEDVDLEDAIEEDDTFLEPEEDEDDSDVADLIDGDIEEDDET